MWISKNYIWICKYRKFNDLSTGLSSECYVDTFFPEDLTKLEGMARERFFHYDFISCPIVYSGQNIKTELISNSNKDIIANPRTRNPSKSIGNP